MYLIWSRDPDEWTSYDHFFSVLRIDWSSLLIQWKRSADDPCGRVVMWDTRGFENIHSGEHQSLLLRYILEGRLHPQNLQQALLLSDETCKKRYVSLHWSQLSLLKMKLKLDFSSDTKTLSKTIKSISSYMWPRQMRSQTWSYFAPFRRHVASQKMKK